MTANNVREEREYAEFLAYPISVILSASFKEQRLPSIWKLADVTPLPKQKPVKEIKKDLAGPYRLPPAFPSLQRTLLSLSM